MYSDWRMFKALSAVGAWSVDHAALPSSIGFDERGVALSDNKLGRAQSSCPIFSADWRGLEALSRRRVELRPRCCAVIKCFDERDVASNDECELIQAVQYIYRPVWDRGPQPSARGA